MKNKMLKVVMVAFFAITTLNAYEWGDNSLDIVDNLVSSITTSDDNSTLILENLNGDTLGTVSITSFSSNDVVGFKLDENKTLVITLEDGSTFTAPMPYDKFISILDGNVTNLKDFIDSNITEVDNNIDSNITNVNNNIDSNITEVNNNIDGNITEVNNNIDGNITNVNNNIDNNITEVNNNIDGNITEVNNNIDNNITEVNNNIDSNITNVNSSIESNVSDLITLIENNETYSNNMDNEIISMLDSNVSSLISVIESNETYSNAQDSEIVNMLDNNITQVNNNIDSNTSNLITLIENNETYSNNRDNEIIAMIDNNVTALTDKQVSDFTGVIATKLLEIKLNDGTVYDVNISEWFPTSTSGIVDYNASTLTIIRDDSTSYDINISALTDEIDKKIDSTPTLEGLGVDSNGSLTLNGELVAVDFVLDLNFTNVLGVPMFLDSQVLDRESTIIGGLHKFNTMDEFFDYMLTIQGKSPIYQDLILELPDGNVTMTPSYVKTFNNIGKGSRYKVIVRGGVDTVVAQENVSSTAGTFIELSDSRVYFENFDVNFGATVADTDTYLANAYFMFRFFDNSEIFVSGVNVTHSDYDTGVFLVENNSKLLLADGSFTNMDGSVVRTRFYSDVIVNRVNVTAGITATTLFEVTHYSNIDIRYSITIGVEDPLNTVLYGLFNVISLEDNSRGFIGAVFTFNATGTTTAVTSLQTPTIVRVMENSYLESIITANFTGLQDLVQPVCAYVSGGSTLLATTLDCDGVEYGAILDSSVMINNFTPDLTPHLYFTNVGKTSFWLKKGSVANIDRFVHDNGSIFAPTDAVTDVPPFTIDNSSMYYNSGSVFSAKNLGEANGADSIVKGGMLMDSAVSDARVILSKGAVLESSAPSNVAVGTVTLTGRHYLP